MSPKSYRQCGQILYKTLLNSLQTIKMPWIQFNFTMPSAWVKTKMPSLKNGEYKVKCECDEYFSISL